MKPLIGGLIGVDKAQLSGEESWTRGPVELCAPEGTAAYQSGLCCMAARRSRRIFWRCCGVTAGVSRGR